jgi:type I restriction enzyme M protein
MLDKNIKQRINTARQILVGKVPDPKAQVEQITNALIYKFMDDMDRSNEELGGKAQFLTGELKDYTWGRLMSREFSGLERWELYTRALLAFSKSQQIPELFRSIFKDAYLPYRDPETLNLFLKEINEFSYNNSENLGNAYEYLLSILGSQGDAGQFRTPRHIIDFIVECVGPKKGDHILDPACGTAGFLISSYKHIWRENSTNFNTETYIPSFAESDSADSFTVEIQKDGIFKGDKLNPSERVRLANNIEGYDISPDMVRLSKVNMYLHNFPEPKIVEYDTLTYDDRWDDNFDVILANPPFMTPKGGIRPHKRFQVQANRAEVLFIDYIAEHLTINGKAGIIVPEGIVFQSATAYKALRKMLVEENYLYAVVSLPAGVFQPYSGVKTSVLLLDRTLAKKNDEILFVKVENDGFDLGAQRRRINKNDLPKAFETIKKWQKGEKEESPIALWVEKSKLAENGEYNFTGDRYHEAIDYSNVKWPVVELDEVAIIQKGSPITRKDIIDGEIPVIAGGQSPAYYNNVANRKGKTITVSSSGAYAGFLNYFKEPIFASDCTTVQSKDENIIISDYLFSLLKSKQDDFYSFQQGMGQPHVYARDFKNYKIPLPPLDIQKEIVAELDGYQKIIDGARQVVENWKPHIKIDPKWEVLELRNGGKVCMCKRIFKDQTTNQGEIPFYKIGTFGKKPDAFISQELFKEYQSKYSYPNKGDILISTSGTIGKTVVFDGKPAYFQDSNIVWIANDETKVLNKFLNVYYQNIKWRHAEGVTIARLYNKIIEETKISIPPLETQIKIVNEVEAEQQIIVSNKALIERYEQKIKDKIAEVWGEA